MKSEPFLIDRDTAERKLAQTFGLILTVILVSVLVLTAVSY